MLRSGGLLYAASYGDLNAALVGSGIKFLVVAQYFTQCPHQMRGALAQDMQVSTSVCINPILRSVLELCVDDPPVGNRVIEYFLSRWSNAALPKSAGPWSALNVFTVLVKCCLGISRRNLSNCFVDSVGDFNKYTQIKLVTTQTISIK